MMLGWLNVITFSQSSIDTYILLYLTDWSLNIFFNQSSIYIFSFNIYQPTGSAQIVACCEFMDALLIWKAYFAYIWNFLKSVSFSISFERSFWKPRSKSSVYWMVEYIGHTKSMWSTFSTWFAQLWQKGSGASQTPLLCRDSFNFASKQVPICFRKVKSGWAKSFWRRGYFSLIYFKFNRVVVPYWVSHSAHRRCRFPQRRLINLEWANK